MSTVTLDPLPRTRLDERARHALPAVGRTVVSAGGRTRWPWVAAGSCFVLYLAVGVWLINSQAYEINDAAARTVSAQIMVLSRDPHLGAMGFYWPPLPMLIRIPFVLLLHPFGQTILAGPVSTALCAALVLPILARIGHELRLRRSTTAVLVGLYALNPVTIFSAANAMSEAMFALVVACLLLAMIRFARDRAVRDLGFIGLALGACMMSRIEAIPLTVAVAVAVVLLVPRALYLRAVSIVVVPPLFVYAMWTWASSLLVGDSLFWYHEAKISGSSVSYRPWLPSPLTPASILGYVAFMMAMLAPALCLAFVVGFGRRREWRSLLALSLVALTIPAFVALQLLMDVTTGEARYFALMPLFQCAISMWVIAHAGDGQQLIRRALPVAVAVLTAVGAIATTYSYAKPARTQITQDGVFFATVVGKPRPGRAHTLEPLKPLAAAIAPDLAAGKFVAMDSKGGTVILYSDYPKQFIVPEDRDFEQIMSDPSGRFDDVILANSATSATSAIRAAMTSVAGGTFVLVGTYDLQELYRFVPDASR